MRAIGMLLVLSVLGLVGLYYKFYMATRYPGLGNTIIVVTLIFALFESLFFLLVERAMHTNRMLPDGLWYFEAILESIFPVVAMVILIDVVEKPFLILLSPIYALMLIITAASSLRLSTRLTLVTGLLSTLCYGLLVSDILFVDKYLHLNPYSSFLYINMTVMLLVATIVMYYVTREMRHFVDVAVHEMELQKELELASEVQKKLLPFPLPALSGYEMTALSKPADHTGGDYFDCVMETPQRVILTIADVTGHGIGPALITASSRAYFRASLGQQRNLADTMQQANHLLSGEMSSGRFVTLAALRLDTVAHQAEFLSAGHAPSLLIRGASGEVVNMSAQSAPMGIRVPLQMEAAMHFKLDPGDLFTMFSDGIYEWRNAAGEQFGLERLTALLQQNRHKSVSDISRLLQQKIELFSSGRPQQDDVTLLLVKRVTD